tara:strand:+ start:2062 stop:2442 length:381 start_codon:yes stop_codon:yes gene_type:complete
VLRLGGLGDALDLGEARPHRIDVRAEAAQALDRLSEEAVQPRDRLRRVDRLLLERAARPLLVVGRRRLGLEALGRCVWEGLPWARAAAVAGGEAVVLAGARAPSAAQSAFIDLAKSTVCMACMPKA